MLRLLSTLLLALAMSAALADTPVKRLSYAFRIAETNFDPAQVTDLYSASLIANMLDAPLQYAFLARPYKIRPNTALAMPEVSEDFRTFTFRIRPGIHFADDPAFKGAKRELVAQDYVFSMKRHFDPRWKSGRLYLLENLKIRGLNELRKEALESKKPFDYAREIEGLRALDRYTFQVKLVDPVPRLAQVFADGAVTGAVAREVVEFYGDAIGDHPVGTGPFRLAEWKRSSRMLFKRNPNYREEHYDEEAPADDALAQAAVRALQGKRLPLVDEMEVTIVEENQPRWLSYARGDADFIWEVPSDFASVVMPNNKLAPNLAKQGMVMVRYPRADVAIAYFQMENPVVGGYTPEKVALRRAIALAYDSAQEIRLVRAGQAVVAQGIVPPELPGGRAQRSEMGEFDRAKARALLDLHGYVDKDGDGWRDLPDGSPLKLEYATQPDQQSRALIEQWEKNLRAIDVRIEFHTAKWPENLKASRTGKLMMWGLGWSAADPDGDTFLALGYGPNKGQANHSRFDLPAFNELYRKQYLLPNGPERQAAMEAAADLMIAYMPYKIISHRIWTDLAQHWVIGYHRNTFVRDFWRYIDVDPAAQAAARQ